MPWVAHASWACPRCFRPVSWEGREAVCEIHGTEGYRLGDVANFIKTEDRDADRVWSWSDDFLPQAAGLAKKARYGESFTPEEEQLARTQGLLDSSGRATNLAEVIHYHDSEVDAQKDKLLTPEFIDSITPESTLLDVGGGAGQTVRWLEHKQMKLRICSDIDLIAVSYGARLLKDSEHPVAFVGASGTDMPFTDQSFSHIISRGSLVCMHQDRGLAELARLLAPGGRLYIHVEGPGYGLRRLARTRGPKMLIGSLRDYAIGWNRQLTGRQPEPGNFWGGNVIFADGHRLAKDLESYGCEILNVRATNPYLGVPLGYEVEAIRPA